MAIVQAREADRAGDVEAAATAYEQAYAAGDRSLELLLDLALLYWQGTDPGLAAALQLDAAFMATAARRMRELLDEAARRFPASTAVRFWNRYIAWAELDEPFAVEECRALLREDATVLVPVMHVFAQTHGQELQTEASELLRQCRATGTTGARYVSSVIEAVLQRACHRA